MASLLFVSQYLAAQDAAPQLDAIIPWEGWNELGPGGGYGGIEERSFMEWLMENWVAPNRHPQAEGVELLEGFLNPEYHLENIDVPALVCASFSDHTLHTYDTFEAFMRMSSEQKWLYNHRSQKWGRFYSAEALELQKRFFDRFLKGKADAMDDVPAVRLEVHENRFDHKVVHAEEWPLSDTRYETYYLDETTDRLLQESPAEEGSKQLSREPVADLDNRAVFDFKFDEDTHIVGYPSLNLWVEGNDTEDIEFFFGIKKLDKNGDEVYFFANSGGNPNAPASMGWQRATRRPRDPERSWQGHPYPAQRTEPLPEGIFDLDIQLMPFGTTFWAGETLRLVIQCWSAEGQFTGGELLGVDWERLQTGPATIHTGPEYSSQLNLPVVDNLNVAEVNRGEGEQ